MRTALVRTESGNLKVVRDDYFKSNADFASELRGNGFKVLKVWAKDMSDAEVDEWELLNRN